MFIINVFFYPSLLISIFYTKIGLLFFFTFIMFIFDVEPTN